MKSLLDAWKINIVASNDKGETIVSAKDEKIAEINY